MEKECKHTSRKTNENAYHLLHGDAHIKQDKQKWGLTNRLLLLLLLLLTAACWL
jgi:hypothetical protein